MIRRCQRTRSSETKKISFSKAEVERNKRTTRLQFRQLLEKHGLTKKVLAAINGQVSPRSTKSARKQAENGVYPCWIDPIHAPFTARKVGLRRALNAGHWVGCKSAQISASIGGTESSGVYAPPSSTVNLGADPGRPGTVTGPRRRRRTGRTAPDREGGDRRRAGQALWRQTSSEVGFQAAPPTAANSAPTTALPSTTSHGGSFQNIRAIKANSARPKSAGRWMALVHTG